MACVGLPDSLSDREAALIEPTEVAVRAVNKAPPRAGRCRRRCWAAGRSGSLTLRSAGPPARGSRRRHRAAAGASRALALELGAAAARSIPGTRGGRTRCAGARAVSAPTSCSSARAGPTAPAWRSAWRGRAAGSCSWASPGVRCPSTPLDLPDRREDRRSGRSSTTTTRTSRPRCACWPTGASGVSPLVTAEIPLADVVRGGFEALTSPGRSTSRSSSARAPDHADSTRPPRRGGRGW